MSKLTDAAPKMLDALKVVLPIIERIHREVEPYTLFTDAPTQIKDEADEIFQAIATVALAIRAAEPEHEQPRMLLPGCECVECRIKRGKLFMMPHGGMQ